MSQSALRIVSVGPVLHTTGKKAGQTSTVATIGSPSQIPGLTKIIGKAWYSQDDAIPTGLVPGACVECGVETREGKDYLTILKFVPANEVETGASLF